MRRLLILLACAGVLAAVPGCDASLSIGGPPTGGPKCPADPERTPDRLSGPLLLTAQSVPTAALVPCLHPLPAGWSFHEMNARKGKTSVVLDFGRGNERAATVTFTRDCDVAGVAETTTDHVGARRYDRVDDATSGYRGEQYYVFAGGCVQYRFALHGAAGAGQVHTISDTLGFVDRDLLRRFVHDRSDGRFELDAGS